MNLARVNTSLPWPISNTYSNTYSANICKMLTLLRRVTHQYFVEYLNLLITSTTIYVVPRNINSLFSNSDFGSSELLENLEIMFSYNRSQPD